jgi:flagellar basal body rod protein FlgC
MQQFTPLSSDGLDVTQGMVSMIVGRQAFQANRNAYQAAQSLLDATLKVGL